MYLALSWIGTEAPHPRPDSYPWVLTAGVEASYERTKERRFALECAADSPVPFSDLNFT